VIKVILNSVFSVALLLVLTSWGEAPSPSLDKKLNRFILKTFKDKEITKSEIDIPDSLQVFNENNFYSLNKGDSLVGFLSFNRANSCRVGGCVAFDSNNRQGNFDPFYFATIYSSDLVIQKMKILEYYSEYGYEISSKGWLKQFENKTGCESDLESEIDGISGATISVKSLIQEVESNCNLFTFTYAEAADSIDLESFLTE
jgi:hypothetical protein